MLSFISAIVKYSVAGKQNSANVPLSKALKSKMSPVEPLIESHVYIRKEMCTYSICLDQHEFTSQVVLLGSANTVVPTFIL